MTAFLEGAGGGVAAVLVLVIVSAIAAKILIRRRLARYSELSSLITSSATWTRAAHEGGGIGQPHTFASGFGAAPAHEQDAGA